MYSFHNCFDDEAISLLDLGVERPRDAMMLGAPKAEALMGVALIQGFGDPKVDRSPMPLCSTATGEPIGIWISLWGRWKPLMPQDQNHVDRETQQH